MQHPYIKLLLHAAGVKEQLTVAADEKGPMLVGSNRRSQQGWTDCAHSGYSLVKRFRGLQVGFEHTCCTSSGREKCSQLILYTRDVGSAADCTRLLEEDTPFS